jgi:hypothetical protein
VAWATFCGDALRTAGLYSASVDQVLVPHSRVLFEYFDALSAPRPLDSARDGSCTWFSGPARIMTVQSWCKLLELAGLVRVRLHPCARRKRFSRFRSGPRRNPRWYVGMCMCVP